MWAFIIISIQATHFPITKMVFIRLLTIKDTSGMNLRINFPQLLDKTCQYRREDFKNQITYWREYITSDKIKIIEVLSMKENN